MNTMQKIEAVSADKSGHELTLRNLRIAIDQAADAGDLAEVKSLQLEVAAAQELSASCDRRIHKLNGDLVVEQKEARRLENDKFFEEFKAAINLLPPRARKISLAIANLIKELEAFKADADVAGKAIRHLTRQLPSDNRWDSFHELPTVAAFNDEALGAAVGEELSKSGLFTSLAHCNSVRLNFRHTPRSLEQFIETHIGNLTRRAARVCSMVNENID